MPPWYINVLGIIAIIGIIILAIYLASKRLMKLWKEVSSKEILFYRQLERTAKLYFSNKEQLINDDNKECYKVITRYRKKRVRSLLMQTRQDLFQSITAIHAEFAEKNEPFIKELDESYHTLQKIRRIYNSRVLAYNQTINIFPTRYLAIRLHLEIKEYFG